MLFRSALADHIITLPVNPSFASLNLAQAVVVVAYEWFKFVSGGKLPFEMPRKSDAAPRQQLLAFFANLERELEKVEFFRPPDKRETMQINLRNIFSRMQPTQQDIQTLINSVDSLRAVVAYQDTLISRLATLTNVPWPPPRR